jgi:transcription initiation factor TFIIIB Brf1 subunit/transcription initiation factor TFIIB
VSLTQQAAADVADVTPVTIRSTYEQFDRPADPPEC